MDINKALKLVILMSYLLLFYVCRCLVAVKKKKKRLKNNWK